MPQYLISIHRPLNYNPSVSENPAMLSDIDVLNEEMTAAGVRIFVGGLQSPESARALSVNEHGEIIVSPGLYLSAPEHVGGLWVLEVSDLDQALVWGKKAAIACRAPVEVRPFHG